MKIKVNIVILRSSRIIYELNNVNTCTVQCAQGYLYCGYMRVLLTNFENLLLREELKLGKIFFRIARSFRDF